jgi:glycosyltransferase involved in cell wall biosynthesis
MPIPQEMNFTVVIPYFNAEEFVDEAIQSVMNQTLPRVEIILVNDGSDKASSLKKLETLKREYKDKITFIDQENKKLPAARNTGVARANSPYLCCLDADDYLEPEYLERAREAFEEDPKGEIGIVTAWVKFFGTRDEIWKPLEKDKAAFFTDNQIQSASSFRKSAWQTTNGFDESFIQGYEDWDFWVRIVCQGYLWKVIPKVLIHYRIKEMSMVTESNKIRSDLYTALIKKNYPFFEENFTSILVQFDKKCQELEQAYRNLSVEYRNLFLEKERVASILNDLRSLNVIKWLRLIKKRIRN